MGVPNGQIGSSPEVKALKTISGQLERLHKTICCDAAAPVEITSSCAKPVYVEICNPDPGTDYELVFTDAVPICVDNGDGTFSTWYTRERIVWDSVTSTVISRTTEYSSDGATWNTTAPSSFTVGACDIDPACNPSITEAFGDDLSTLAAGHNFSITKPSCCKIKVTTSVGSFHVLDNIQFYNTSDFGCPVTISAIEVVSGNCTLDKVHIISNKLF